MPLVVAEDIAEMVDAQVSMIEVTPTFERMELTLVKLNSDEWLVILFNLHVEFIYPWLWSLVMPVRRANPDMTGVDPTWNGMIPCQMIWLG